MKLIIGKNSKIVKSIKDSLVDCRFLSHNDLSLEQDYSEFTHIIIFSWSHKSLEDNINLYHRFPANKIVFISTTAVLSLQKRAQWNKYPNWKNELENIALANGSKVIRIGVWNKSLIAKMPDFLPYTSAQQLIDLINSIQNKNKNKFYFNCFKINKGGLHGKLSSLLLFLTKISDIFPSKFIFQAPIELFFKLVGIKFYGYTRDSNYFFGDNLLIGNGCLGGAYKNYNKIDRVLTSEKKDSKLTKNGFVDTILGFNNNGLSKYWHGAYVKAESKHLTKHVPLIVKRSKKVNSNFELHVDDINFYENFATASGIKHNMSVTFFCNRLILAAGPTENCRLLSKFSSSNVIYFDDHELMNFGTISLKQACKKNYIKQFFIFITPKHVNQLFINEYEVLIEARPFNDIKVAGNIFANTTTNIIKKLIRRFSFLSINEAVFNKFRISIRTNKVVLSGQILVKNCIKYDIKNNSFIRHRIPQIDIDKFHKQLKERYTSYSKLNYNSFDGQHICGGMETIKSNEIQMLLEANKLKILGSPSNFNLTSFHHTQEFINRATNND
jgi:hypothetical protein